MSTKDLKQIAQKVATLEKVNKVFVTSDGQAFLADKESYAKYHADQKGLKVHEFDFDEEAEVEAQAKVKAEIAVQAETDAKAKAETDAKAPVVAKNATTAGKKASKDKAAKSPATNK